MSIVYLRTLLISNVDDARALEKAGAFSDVLECIPDTLAKVISEAISIPTIGIGAGRFCDGQVLVTHDLLGLFEKFIPKFVKQYANLAPDIKKALAAYVREVKSGGFPGLDQSFVSDIDFEDILHAGDRES